MIYEGKNVNANAMQLSSSINPFGVEIVLKETETSTGKEKTNESVGKKWIIQPKMETPMLNFNNLGVKPITNAAGNLTLPAYSSGSVPRGMWHQFGAIEPDENKGIFLEIGDIPRNWLRFHYDVRSNNSIYNRNSASTYGEGTAASMKPLTDIIKFSKDNTSKRLGEIKESTTIKEAVVAVPYINDVDCADGSNLSFANKKFFNINKKMMSQKEGTVSDLMETMQSYVLPPQFDFVNNKTIQPMAMYIFEFDYTFDKDDLSYIWQNLAPRNYKKITKETSSTSHTLGENELLSKEDIISENLRWMVFKVKQRSQVEYEDLIVSQAGQSTKQINNKSSDDTGYQIKFNWPYDYVSFVETIKFESTVLYTEED